MAAQFEPNQIKLESADAGENITEIQNYLDTFNKEIEGGDGTTTIQAVTGRCLGAVCLCVAYNECVLQVMTMMTGTMTAGRKAPISLISRGITTTRRAPTSNLSWLLFQVLVMPEMKKKSSL